MAKKPQSTELDLGFGASVLFRLGSESERKLAESQRISECKMDKVRGVVNLNIWDV